MGIDIKGCTEEEDFAYEEATQAIRGKGIEGCDVFEQVLGMWKCQESAFALPILREW
jgi:hypothetical protein